MADFDEVELSGTTYKIPKANSNPPWGEELNDFLNALANLYSGVIGVGDITETAAVIANNQTTEDAVSGLAFDSAVIRAAFIQYSIFRTTDTNTALEQGQLNVIYNPSGTVGSKWILQRESMGGDSGIEFTISDAGVVNYTSTDLTGPNYTGEIRFQAQAVLQ